MGQGVRRTIYELQISEALDIHGSNKIVAYCFKKHIINSDTTLEIEAQWRFSDPISDLHLMKLGHAY